MAPGDMTFSSGRSKEKEKENGLSTHVYACVRRCHASGFGITQKIVKSLEL
jgi:hypothetical protein